jgi:anti-sigma factor RsiW
MNEALQDRIEDYLDGVLDTEESQRFEEQLVDDVVAAEFRELLLLRELLGRLPPDQPPPALVQRIESALVSGRKDRPKLRNAAPTRVFGGFVGALKAGMSWTGYVAFGMSGGSGAMKGSVDGMQAITYAMGPLREPARNGLKAMRLKPKAIWKTALSKGWRRVWP